MCSTGNMLGIENSSSIVHISIVGLIKFWLTVQFYFHNCRFLRASTTDAVGSVSDVTTLSSSTQNLAAKLVQR